MQVHARLASSPDQNAVLAEQFQRKLEAAQAALAEAREGREVLQQRLEAAHYANDAAAATHQEAAAGYEEQLQALAAQLEESRQATAAAYSWCVRGQGPHAPCAWIHDRCTMCVAGCRLLRSPPPPPDTPPARGCCPCWCRSQATTDAQAETVAALELQVQQLQQQLAAEQDAAAARAAQAAAATEALEEEVAVLQLQAQALQQQLTQQQEEAAAAAEQQVADALASYEGQVERLKAQLNSQASDAGPWRGVQWRAT